jgi:hypothetical protein
VYVTVRTDLCGLIDDSVADGDTHEVDAHLVRGTDECGANKGREEERRGGELAGWGTDIKCSARMIGFNILWSHSISA